MKKTIFVLLDACQYEAGTRNLGYLEHLIDYKKGAKYKVKGELPSLSRPMYATLLTGTPVFSHGITTNDTLRTLDCDNVFSLCQKQGGKTAAAAYHWFGELYNHIPFRIDRERIQLQSSETINSGIYYWDDTYPDSHLFADGEFLRQNQNPDFLLIHPETGAIFLWEHLGLWYHETSSEFYRNEFNGKTDIYRNLGFIPGVNLLMSFETPLGLDMERIAQEVDHLYNLEETAQSIKIAELQQAQFADFSLLKVV